MFPSFHAASLILKEGGKMKSETNPKREMEINARLNEKTTYHFENRSFIVEPIFKDESPDTLGSVLLRLMKSESEKA